MSSRFCRCLGALLVGTTLSGSLLLGRLLRGDGTHPHAKLPEHLRPYRPLGIRVLNAVGGTLDRWGFGMGLPMDPDRLLSEACSELATTILHRNREEEAEEEDDAATALPCVLLDTSTSTGRTFNNDLWHASFRRYVEALNEAKLTFLGTLVAKGNIAGMLKTRGLLLDAFEKDPSHEPDRLLHDPVFVVGLPRTGTTLLSRLLALDPVHRAPTLWEYMDPVPRPPPPPPPSNATPEQLRAYRSLTADRIAVQQNLLGQYTSLAPGLNDLHPMDATFPEECIIIMNMAMDSYQMGVTFPVQEYAEWLLQLDHHRDVLEWNKRVLEHLQTDDVYGPRRWILKTPYYLTMMDDIRTIHPNAKIVHTHRDPAESIPSIASLIAKTHSIVTDDIDLHRIGAQQADLHKTMLQKALEVRARWTAAEEGGGGADDEPNDGDGFRVVDVQLGDLQRNPVATVDRIYRALFDAPLDRGVADEIERWLEKHPRKPHGPKRPTPSDFGLEDRLFEDGAVFAAYQRVFGAKPAASCNTGGNDDPPASSSFSVPPPPTEL